MIRVVSKHHHQPQPGQTDFYIGRGSALGNPATSIQGKATKADIVCATVEESLDYFAWWLDEQIVQRNQTVCGMLNIIWVAARQGDVNLVCFCKQPGKDKSCHGDIIKAVVEKRLTKQDEQTS